jgi:hypothetical protein
MTMIRAAIYDKPSNNAFAAGKGYRILKPSDPYRSTLFRKVHNGLDASVNRDAAEGASMSGSMTNFEVEMIRQWIIAGSDLGGTVVDTALIQDYYAGNGYASMATPPAAPNPAEGFQVHLGPLFIAANSEVEGYWKYDTDLPSSKEVHTIVPKFGTMSHHLLLFKARPGMENMVPEGWRPDQAHYYEELVTAHQYADSIHLPTGTAFSWTANAALDLNSHYINYDLTKVLAADAYLNVYTQTAGTAAQVMKSEIIANTSIYIPNDGVELTFNDDIRDPGNYNEVFLWGMGGHTHQWGTGYRVYTLDASLNEDQFVYDAAYEHGDPNGMYIGFDYRHPPSRYWEGFLPVVPHYGLRHYASYVNLGPGPVAWGPTSDDEMMVLYYFYLEDTAGVPIIGRPDAAADLGVRVGPNPTSEMLYLQLEAGASGTWQVSLLDLQGREMLHETWVQQGAERKALSLSGLPAGIYFVRIQNPDGQSVTKKIVKTGL